MYKFLRPLLFRMDAEKAHHLTFGMLHAASKIPGFLPMLRQIYDYENPILEKELMGLKFKNPVGLAAGLDKNAEFIHELAALGFGFVEIGTVTPRPQAGNPKPRLFRLPKDKALINRMGFNNAGVEAVAQNLEKRPPGLIIGGNIGKNKDTPNEEAVKDYLISFNRLFDLVDYFVVNVSSPNTPGLRALQDKKPLQKLLAALQEENKKKSESKPLLLKIAPDLETGQIEDIVKIVRELALDGIVATNTSISREGLSTAKSKIEAVGNGGLSGAPLFDRSTQILRTLRAALGPGFVLIGTGGITDGATAVEKMRAGADLIQVYSGLIYRGPALVIEIKKALIEAGITG